MFDYLFMLFFYIVWAISPYSYTKPPIESKVAVIHLRSPLTSQETVETLDRSLKEELSELAPYLPLEAPQVREAVKKEGLESSSDLSREEALKVGKRLEAALFLALQTGQEKGALTLRFRLWDTAEEGELLLEGALRENKANGAGELGKKLAGLVAEKLRGKERAAPAHLPRPPRD